MSNLTQKQENFCQAFVKLGDKSAAYREAYNVSKMKPESVHRKSFELFNNVNVTARIRQIQAETLERNKVDLDELLVTMSSMIRFDIADLYDENGVLKSIHLIPKHARLMISQIKATEEFQGFGDDRTMIGYTKEVKLYDKLAAIDKMMKHFGGYEKDNEQKANILSPQDRSARLAELKSKL